MLNEVPQYSQFPIPIINAILDNITSTNFIFNLDLTAWYVQIAMKLWDIVITVFNTRIVVSI